MKIAFWSEQEKAGTTFNMAAVACASVLLYPADIIVMPGGYQDEDLQNNFTPVQGRKAGWEKTELAAEENGYFMTGGMDCLLRKKEQEELTEQFLKANMKQVVPGRMYCLPCGKHKFTQWWDKELLFERMEQVVRAAEEQIGIVFIDCGNRKDDFSRKMLKEADVCVLNMHQEAEQIGTYYQKRLRLRGKVFFLVGSYFGESAYNRKNLQNIYRIEEKELGAIPYNTRLRAAGASGNVQGCIEYCLKEGRNPEFAQELVRSTRLIMELAGVPG